MEQNYGVERAKRSSKVPGEIHKMDTKSRQTDRWTPSYMLMLDTGREKIEVMAAKRIVLWEKKLKEKDRNSLEGICWELRSKENVKERKHLKEKSKQKERREMIEKIGQSGREWTKKIDEEGEGAEWKVQRRMKDINRQVRRERLGRSRFVGELRNIIGNDERIYEGKIVKRSKDALEVIPIFRLGSETRSCKYWKKEEEWEYRLCRKETGEKEHMMQRCEYTGVDNENWEDQIRGGKKMTARLKKLVWNTEEERKEGRGKNDIGENRE